MKKLFLISTALLAVVSSAQSADIAARPYAKAPPMVAASNWTGFYLSGGGGYGMMTHDVQTSTAPGIFTQTSIFEQGGGRGYFGTVGGGYDYQFAGSWLAGIFADAQFGAIKGHLADPASTMNGEFKNDLNFAAGARLGYLVAPNVLSYVNGGYTRGRFSGVTTAFNSGPPGTVSTVPGFESNGWFVGGGTEHTLNFFGISAPGWFLKSEYRLAEYNRSTQGNTPVGAVAPLDLLSVKPYVQSFTSQLVYRFNSGVSQTASEPLYTKAPRMAAANWTGFYIGGGGGYGMVSADEHSEFPLGVQVSSVQRQGGRGYFGTVSGGYDYQFAPRWVAGVLADGQFANIRASLVDSSFNNFASLVGPETSWAVGGRLGYLVAPNVLSYFNGGYTHADFNGAPLLSNNLGAGAAILQAPGFSSSGYFLGGGFENSLNIFGLNMPGWFMKTEYRVAQYKERIVPETLIAGGRLNDNLAYKPQIQTISTQLVYRFNSGL